MVINYFKFTVIRAVYCAVVDKTECLATDLAGLRADLLRQQTAAFNGSPAA